MPDDSIQLVFKIVAENQAALNNLRAGLGALNAQVQANKTSATALQVANNNLLISLNTLTSSVGALTNAMGSASTGTRQLSGAFSGGLLMSRLYYTGLRLVLDTLKEMFITAPLYAARTDQLGKSLEQLAKVNGLSNVQIQNQVRNLVALGFSTQSAREAMSQLVSKHSDLSNATRLGTAAMNIAYRMGLNYDDVLKSLTSGITNLQTRQLKQLGIIVDLNSAYAQHGKHLTEDEKENVAQAAVLEAVERSYGKQLLSMDDVNSATQRLTTNLKQLKDAFGEQLQGPLAGTLDFLNRFVVALGNSVIIIGAISKTIAGMKIDMGGGGAPISAPNGWKPGGAAFLDRIGSAFNTATTPQGKVVNDTNKYPTAQDLPGAKFGELEESLNSSGDSSLKSAQKAADQARANLLDGLAKLEAERKNAYAELAEKTRDSRQQIADARVDANRETDPVKRAALMERIDAASSKIGGAFGALKSEYDSKEIEFRRNEAVKGVGYQSAIDAAQGSASNSWQRKQMENSIADTVSHREAIQDPTEQQKLITEEYQKRVSLAETLRAQSQQTAEKEWQDAVRSNQAKANADALNAAANKKAIEDIKIQADYQSQMEDADRIRDKEKAAQRKADREQMRLDLNLSREWESAVTKNSISNNDKSVSRAIRLNKARLGSSDSVYGGNLDIALEMAGAQSDFNTGSANTQLEWQQAQENYANGGTSADLQKASLKYREDSLSEISKLENEIADMRLSKEEQIADIRKQQDEELKATLGQLYDALRTHKTNQFFHDFLNQQVKTIFTNAGTEIFRGTLQQLGGIIPGQEQIDPQTGKPNGQLSPLGKILHGTLLGVDPAKLAAAQNVAALNSNTQALLDLLSALTGKPATVSGGGGGSNAPVTGNAGGTGGFWNILGGLLGGGTGWGTGGGTGLGNSSVIKNFGGGGWGGIFNGGGNSNSQSSSGGGGGTWESDGSSTDMSISSSGSGGIGYPSSGSSTWGQNAAGIAVAAAVALPVILQGIKQGGLQGGLEVASGGLGIGAAVDPEPISKSILAIASVATGLFAGLFKTPFEKWQQNMSNALSDKYNMPAPIMLSEDLAGQSMDYNFRGGLQGTGMAALGTGYGKQSGNIQVTVQTMDSRSFMDNSSKIAEAVRQASQYGHPINDQIKHVTGVNA